MQPLKSGHLTNQDTLKLSSQSFLKAPHFADEVASPGRYVAGEMEVHFGYSVVGQLCRRGLKWRVSHEELIAQHAQAPDINLRYDTMYIQCSNVTRCDTCTRTVQCTCTCIYMHSRSEPQFLLPQMPCCCCYSALQKDTSLIRALFFGPKDI